MSEDPTMEMLAEIDREMAGIEKAVSALQQQAAQANYPQHVETTTEMLAEIEGQAADYTPPDGWRVLQPGEVLEGEDWLIDPRNGKRRPTLRLGHKVEHQIYIRRIESEPEPEGSCPQLHPWLRTPPEQQADRILTPDDVAAEALQQQLEATELALLEQQQRNEQLVTQGSQQRMETAELQAQVNFLKGRELTLGTRLQDEKAVSTKRLEQLELLRSEVSYVQGLLGESKRRVVELETLVKDLRNINATAEKSVEAAARQNADLQHRLDTVAAEWAQQAETSRLLQIELDAREQVPQAVSDRFEEGWDAGTAQAVEAIAEWLEPLRKGNCTLRAAVLFHLPAIMRSLTGLTEGD